MKGGLYIFFTLSKGIDDA